MDVMLAVLVPGAVIFFGALISLGSERQRRAIDALRGQVVLWAIQDLRLKREHLAREVKVDDPLGWLNRLVSKAWGSEAHLQVVEAHEHPQALVCASHNARRVIFSPLSPAEIRAWKRTRKGRLGRFTNGNPLLDLPRGVQILEFSILNGGMSFDLELPLAWKGLTGQTHDQIERIWMFQFPA